MLSRLYVYTVAIVATTYLLVCQLTFMSIFSSLNS